MIARGLAAQYPDTNKKFTAVGLTSELEHLVGRTRARMVILLISVGVLLLIAGMNVANLLWSGPAKRNREIALRAALGARRIRVGAPDAYGKHSPGPGGRNDSPAYRGVVT